jgi:hypothetical protein
MKNLIIIATALLLACSFHSDPSVTRTAAPITDCYTPVPAGAIAGFGVDGQPRQWGTDGRNVKPALDLLVNDLGANFFRVEVNDGETDWEDVNDDSDPKAFNWAVLDSDFNTKEFQDLANYVRELNKRGVNNVELALHGGLPNWMCAAPAQPDNVCYSLDSAFEDEWVETALAPLVWLRTRAPYPQPRFNLFSPFNEPEFSPPEGFKIDPVAQGASIIHKLVVRMNELPELTGIQLVVSDSASEPGMITFRQAIQGDAVAQARLAATSFHRYSDASTWTTWNNSSPPVWLTEFNSTWVQSCYPTTWAMGMQAAGNLISALQNGVTAGLAWSDYDAPHVHQNNEWQSFGLLATTYQGNSNLCGAFNDAQPSDAALDAMTYTPKPTYLALRHAFKYIRPNATPITMTATGGVLAVAYKNADGTVAVFGRSSSATNSTITLTMSNPPAYLTPRITTATTTDVVGSPSALAGGQGVFSFPGFSVFTLLSSPGSGSGGTGGTGGQGGMSSGGNAGSGGQSAGNGGVSGDGTAGASSGAPSGGQSGSSAGGQSGAGGAVAGAGGQSSGGAGQGGAGTSSGGAGAGGAAAGMAGASGSGGSGLPQLIAGWAFNEGSGSTTADASGHGHTGTINGATWTTTGCKYGACLSFTGTGHNVTTPDAADLDLGTGFTIMAWVKPTTTAGWRPVLIKENGTNLEAYLLYSNPSNQGAYFTDSGNVEKSVTGGSAISTTQWTNVAMVRNGTTLSYWVNGVSVASTTVSSLPVVASSGILAIGGHTFWGGEWYSGVLDDVRLYNAALTSSQLASAMGAGL